MVLSGVEPKVDQEKQKATFMWAVENKGTKKGGQGMGQGWSGGSEPKTPQEWKGGARGLVIMHKCLPRGHGP